jgi:thioredoxin 2
MAGPVHQTPALIRCPLCSAVNRVDLARHEVGPRCGECGRPLLLDRPLEATDTDFERLIRGTEVPVLVDFHADWCGPCRIMAPTLDDFAREHAGRVLILKLDTDRDPETPQRFGIRGIPTLVAFRHGQETGRLVGVVPLADIATLAFGRAGEVA